jgi:hypothetical protein
VAHRRMSVREEDLVRDFDRSRDDKEPTRTHPTIDQLAERGGEGKGSADLCSAYLSRDETEEALFSIVLLL